MNAQEFGLKPGQELFEGDYRTKMAELREAGCTHASVGSFNNEIGVPLTLLQLTAAHRYAVVEMGAGKPGDIALLTAIVKPTVAIITNIGPAHLEAFGTIDVTAATKAEIFEWLPHIIPVPFYYSIYNHQKLKDCIGLLHGHKT